MPATLCSAGAVFFSTDELVLTAAQAACIAAPAAGVAGLGEALSHPGLGARPAALDRRRDRGDRARSVDRRPAHLDRTDRGPGRMRSGVRMGGERCTALARFARAAAARNRLVAARRPHRSGSDDRPRRRVGGHPRSPARRGRPAPAAQGGGRRDGGRRRDPGLLEQPPGTQRGARGSSAGARPPPAAVGLVRARRPRLRGLLRRRRGRRNPRHGSQAPDRGGAGADRSVAVLGSALSRLRRVAGDDPARGDADRGRALEQAPGARRAVGATWRLSRGRSATTGG